MVTLRISSILRLGQGSNDSPAELPSLPAAHSRRGIDAALKRRDEACPSRFRLLCRAGRGKPRLCVATRISMPDPEKLMRPLQFVEMVKFTVMRACVSTGCPFCR